MLTVDDRGQGNKIVISPAARESLQGTVILHGDENVVEIGDDCSSTAGMRFELGSRCVLQLSDRIALFDAFIWMAADAAVSIDADSGLNGSVRLLLHEPGRITIGHACLFAGGVEMSVSDMHSVIDVASGLRINPPADITIGNHVWVGQGTLVLKGARIGDGSVVGASSLVSGTLPSYALCVGSPARVIREQTTWDFRLLPWDQKAINRLPAGRRPR